jgi:chaperone required for assembly of F1-ATPase
MKRFWDNAEIAAEGDGWRVLLDGRPLRLPGGGPLLLRGQALAAAVAAEWQAAGAGKGGEMSYAEVPLTRLAGTAQDRIAPDPEPVVLELSRYAESDLLCYRAARPDELVRRQHGRWQPWLDWASVTYGARLRITTGVMPVAQAPAALAALAQAVAAHDALALSALGIAVPALGSLVLGLALAAGRIDAEAAHALATLDETFQEEIWGRVDEAAARRQRIADEVATAGRLLALCRVAGPAG